MTRPKIVVDKHLDPKSLGSLIDYLPLSAATDKPHIPYRGKYANDEDFADVLQLAWANFAPLLTADGKMIEKAKLFPEQFGVHGAEKCLRGVVVLPRGDEAPTLAAFLRGDIKVMAGRKRGPVPTTLEEIEDENLGVDLRQEHPRAVELCDPRVHRKRQQR